MIWFPFDILDWSKPQKCKETCLAMELGMHLSQFEEINHDMYQKWTYLRVNVEKNGHLKSSEPIVTSKDPKTTLEDKIWSFSTSKWLSKPQNHSTKDPKSRSNTQTKNCLPKLTCYWIGTSTSWKRPKRE